MSFIRPAGSLLIEVVPASSRTRPPKGLNLWVWPEIRHNPIGGAISGSGQGRVGDRINAAPAAVRVYSPFRRAAIGPDCTSPREAGCVGRNGEGATPAPTTS